MDKVMRQDNFVIAVFIAVFLPNCAGAQPLVQSQEGIALENQILQLQNQMQQIQGSGGSALGGGQVQAVAPPDSGASGSAPSSDLVGNLLNQVSQLQAQVQQLSGRVDTLQNQVDTQHAASEKEIGDLTFKLGGGAGSLPAGAPQPLNGGAANPNAAASAQPPSSSSQSAGLSPSPATVSSAQSALSRRDYSSAESDARSILSTTQSTSEGYKAQYVLAEALYGEGRPQDAAIAFDNAYNRDRAGTYAPGSLLGLANSLTDIHQQSAACDTLSSLNSQFPSPPSGMGPRILAAEARAKCN